jgi:hypothetical protein
MTAHKEIALEQFADKGFRAIIFDVTNGVALVEDIAEAADLAALLNWVTDVHADVIAVRTVRETIYPDALTVFELAEAVMVDTREPIQA